jgi:hypothetical protein
MARRSYSGPSAGDEKEGAGADVLFRLLAALRSMENNGQAGFKSSEQAIALKKVIEKKTDL